MKIDEEELDELIERSDRFLKYCYGNNCDKCDIKRFIKVNKLSVETPCFLIYEFMKTGIL